VNILSRSIGPALSLFSIGNSPSLRRGTKPPDSTCTPLSCEAYRPKKVISCPRVAKPSLTSIAISIKGIDHAERRWSGVMTRNHCGNTHFVHDSKMKLRRAPLAHACVVQARGILTILFPDTAYSSGIPPRASYAFSIAFFMRPYSSLNP